MSALAHERLPVMAPAPIDWRVSVPGLPSIVSTARRLVRTALADSPRVDDIELIVSELVTNAIRHTRSGATGSAVTLRILAEPTRARVEVIDLGRTSWVRPSAPSDEDECGRGLLIVNALADRAGHEKVPLGQVSWAEISWAEPHLSAVAPRRVHARIREEGAFL